MSPGGPCRAQELLGSALPPSCVIPSRANVQLFPARIYEPLGFSARVGRRGRQGAPNTDQRETRTTRVQAQASGGQADRAHRTRTIVRHEPLWFRRKRREARPTGRTEHGPRERCVHEAEENPRGNMPSTRLRGLSRAECPAHAPRHLTDRLAIEARLLQGPRRHSSGGRCLQPAGPTRRGGTMRGEGPVPSSARLRADPGRARPRRPVLSVVLPRAAPGGVRRRPPFWDSALTVYASKGAPGDSFSQTL